MQPENYFVPFQNQGFESDLKYSITTTTIEDAEDCFVEAKDRLLNVNKWNTYNEAINVEFRLTDHHGKSVSRPARKGDYIRINSEENKPDGGFDWLMITAIEYDDYPDLNTEMITFRIRSAKNPLNSISGNGHGAPLPDIDGASDFIVERTGKKLFASYSGANTSKAGPTGLDNTFGGAASSRLQAPYIKWTHLVKEFVCAA